MGLPRAVIDTMPRCLGGGLLLAVLLASAGANARQAAPPERIPRTPDTASEAGQPGEDEARAAALSARAEAGDEEAIAALIPLLHHPDSRTRYHAFWGLARAGAPAVPGLRAAFQARSDDAGRARVAGVLGRIGLPARPAIPDMREGLSDPQSTTAGQAAFALGRMQARIAADDLVRTYAASRKPSNLRQIARALREIGAEQAARASKAALVDAVRAELEGARDARVAAVSFAATLYRAARNDGAYDYPTREELRPLVPGLVAALERPDTAADAVRAVTLAGADAADAAPALGRLLDDPARHHEAMKALRALGTPEARGIVEARLQHETLEARIKTHYHFGDHQGRTWLQPFVVQGTRQRGVLLSVRFLYYGRVPRRPSHVVVGLDSFADAPRFEEHRELRWKADGALYVVGELDRNASKARPGIIEQLSGTMRVEDFLAVARAARVTAQIGDLAFSLSDSDRAALRHFAAKIPAPGPVGAR